MVTCGDLASGISKYSCPGLPTSLLTLSLISDITSVLAFGEQCSCAPTRRQPTRIVILVTMLVLLAQMASSRWRQIRDSSWKYYCHSDSSREIYLLPGAELEDRSIVKFYLTTTEVVWCFELSELKGVKTVTMNWFSWWVYNLGDNLLWNLKKKSQVRSTKAEIAG